MFDVEAALKHDCATLIQRLFDVVKIIFKVFFDLQNTLYQRYFDVASLLVKATSKPIGLVICIDLQTDG